MSSAVTAVIYGGQIASVMIQSRDTNGNAWRTLSVRVGENYDAFASHILGVTGRMPSPPKEYSDYGDLAATGCGYGGDTPALIVRMCEAIRTPDTTWIMQLATGPSPTRRVAALLACSLLVERKVLGAQRMAQVERFILSGPGYVVSCNGCSVDIVPSAVEFMADEQRVARVLKQLKTDR